MKVALDTNILAYAEGVNNAEKQGIALELLHSLPQHLVLIPAQVMGELFNVLTRRAGRTRAAARAALLTWCDAFTVVDTTAETLLAATDLATDHQLSIWDALILAIAAQARCRVLLSEDLQNGFTWGGVTVINPFVSPRPALLTALLD